MTQSSHSPFSCDAYQPHAALRARQERRSSEESDTLEQTMELLARREMWHERTIATSGVRHIKIQVLRPKRRRA